MFSSDLESEERDGEQGSLTKLKSLSMVGNSALQLVATIV